MDLKDRSLRRLNSKSLRRDGFKVFSSKLLIALNNAEQQKALARTRRTNQISLKVLLLRRCFSFPLFVVFVVCGDVSNEKFDFCISDSPLKKIFL